MWSAHGGVLYALKRTLRKQARLHRCGWRLGCRRRREGEVAGRRIDREAGEVGGGGARIIERDVSAADAGDGVTLEDDGVLLIERLGEFEQ